ncbi:MAG TPA: glycosyltransferase [Rhodopila sp.]|nr:glycosyltransferase [Rhodopila sp.]
MPAGPPILCIVVDAEEEFQWGRPVSAQNNATISIRSQRKAQQLFSGYGVAPTYLVTYPIASNPVAVGVLQEFLAGAECEIGAQLHPWVTPPFQGGAPAEHLSFPGNLAEEVEGEKLRRLTDAIRRSFDVEPTSYKAGRYGFGPHTAKLLEDEGYLIDTSLIPRTHYTDAGGPDFSAFDYGPFWFGRQRRILELPVTRALTGVLAEGVPGLYRVAERKLFRSIRSTGLLARSGLLERITLSPEGSDLPAMLRLTRELLRGGQRIFTLSYHSPSLEPGNTPYVRTPEDLAIFLDRLSGYLSFFRDELGGRFMTLNEVHRHLSGQMVEADAARPMPVRHKATDGNHCLVVANTFPPVHGGSAIVYDSLARFGKGRVSVLAPQEDYRNGLPIQGWREFDRSAPFPIHRIRLLRTHFLPEKARIFRRLYGIVAELSIRISVLSAIRKIIRTEDVKIVCVGELVAGGWLAAACRRFFKVKTIIYVHGEEISTRTSYDQAGLRRRRALADAAGIVAVSRFTRQALIEGLGVPPEKIQLISNGVDLGRFSVQPSAKHLVDRYGLAGRRVLLTVGRLYARKGVDKVIEALPQILRGVPDLVYLVVGAGTYRSTLQALAAEHQVTDHVAFAGAVPDHELTAHYGLADAFIMANRELSDGDTEGFGLVFLEANACGVPVVAGKAGGSTDAVTDRVNGLVIDGTNVGEIVTAVVSLFSDAELRARLIAQGRVVAEASSWDQRVEQFLEFCDRVVDKRDS